MDSIAGNCILILLSGQSTDTQVLLVDTMLTTGSHTLSRKLATNYIF